MPHPRVLYWFRTDLRVHDSPALHAALALEPQCLYPVWCWDPHYVREARVGPNRWQFLIQCQRDLSASLTRLNPAQRLLVLREAPGTLLPKLFKEWAITHLVFEKDTDSYAAQRDAEIVKLAQEADVQVITRTGRTLWDPAAIIKENGGKATMSLTSFMKASKNLGDPPKPLPEPSSIPDPGDLSLSFLNTVPPTVIDLNKLHRQKHDDESYSALAGPNSDFAPPTLEELGIPESTATTPHQGGETVALTQLAKLLEDSKFIATFEKPKTAPTAFEPAATTLLSPHLHFGSLSVRRFLHDVQRVTSAYKGSKSQPPTNLPGQLYFRDMYFAAQHAVGPAFSHTVGNPVVRYIPWHLPSTMPPSPTAPYTIDSPRAHAWFLRWAWGVTGFPFVDALMRQLRQEGWIHHLGRHMVACFLTRGGAYVDWERGAEVFEELLLDHEPACNLGNWMWLSCTAFFAQYYRCYSPVAFGKKWDPHGAFVRRYVPELRGFADKWIYEPHLAPEAEQRKAGCFIRDLEDGGLLPLKTQAAGQVYYPSPMFDFAERRDFCLAQMKKAYQVGLHGDDPRVRDGTAKAELFEQVESSENTTTASTHKRKRTRSTNEAGPLDGWVKKGKK
ncbi:DNA photolyase [Auriscalpium vulgare]|uniref:DNA photolyase n=1 Tax=Auriscalpium vulgare TaxID=40419 RepID=A0ACB8S508_9AGAM|nr:DNA photolyase [Auriscalpium vulgare]